MGYITKMNGESGQNSFSAVGFSILGQPPSISVRAPVLRTNVFLLLNHTLLPPVFLTPFFTLGKFQILA